MHKYILGLAMTFGVLLLAGCSVQLADSTPTPVPSATIATTPTLDADSYLGKVKGWLGQYTADIESFAALIQNPQFGDTSWVRSLGVLAARIRITNRDVLSTLAPDSDQEAHDLILSIAHNMDKVADGLEQASNTKDVSNLLDAGNSLQAIQPDVTRLLEILNITPAPSK